MREGILCSTEVRKTLRWEEKLQWRTVSNVNYL